MDTMSLILSTVLPTLTFGLAWIGKTIVKPWSDAYLLRSQAFVTYVETQSKGMDALVAETKAQTNRLISIDTKMTEQNSVLRDTRSDAANACKSESNLSSIVSRLDKLDAHVLKQEHLATIAAMAVAAAGKTNGA